MNNRFGKASKRLEYLCDEIEKVMADTREKLKTYESSAEKVGCLLASFDWILMEARLFRENPLKNENQKSANEGE